MPEPKLSRDQITADLDSLLVKAENRYEYYSDKGDTFLAMYFQGLLIAYTTAIDLLLQGDLK